MINLKEKTQAVIDGLSDPIELLIEIKATMKDLEGQVAGLKEYYDNVMAYGVSEYERMGGKPYVYDSVKIEKRNSPKIFDFSNDETYTLLENKLKNRKSELKSSFEYYIQGRELVIDSEVIPIPALTSGGKEYLVFKL